jgi:hypothetical protein
MSSSSDHDVDDDALVRYLTGRVTSEEAERFDELSIADDGLAERLRAIENDLVDAYARGELTGTARDAFTAGYLAAPGHREKVKFAEALYAREKKPTPRAGLATQRLSPRRFLIPYWGGAVAALLLIAVTGLLVAQNLKLQREIADARTTRATLEQRQRDLQGQLSSERTARTQIASELARVRDALAAGAIRDRVSETHGVASLVSFLLMPSRRGIADVPQIAIPRATREIEIRLLLESDEFASYRVTLRDPGSDRPIWRSPLLASARSSDGQVVRTSVPTTRLASRHYMFELTGIPKAGEPDVIASYPVAVVLK